MTTTGLTKIVDFSRSSVKETKFVLIHLRPTNLHTVPTKVTEPIGFGSVHNAWIFCNRFANFNFSLSEN